MRYNKYGLRKLEEKKMIDLEQNVQYLKGVGPNRVKYLNRLGIFTLQDLLTYYPREYEDRTKIKPILETIDGEEVVIKGTVMEKMTEQHIRKNMTIYKLSIGDETGICHITWFNQSYLKTKFKIGQTYQFFGKISNHFGRIEMNSPIFEEENQNRNIGKIVPVYSATQGITQNIFRQIVLNLLKLVGNDIEETMPEYLLEEKKLIKLSEAIFQIHFPITEEEMKKARRRLVFEELLTMQVALLGLKGKYNDEKIGISYPKEIKMEEVIQRLPFQLTGAQLRVLEEMNQDMESGKPMNRLLQGDVGSGKTIVSMIAAYKAAKSGYQVAIMAPTAILAQQHLVNFKKILEPLGITCELLISNIAKKQKDEIKERLKEGKIDIIIGTHALLQENVVFAKLGFVVTDEQHRFGVRQRSTLATKGENPDVLVMTATPIPRTLAIILYGDLDISIIDELPPNRKKIETYAVTKAMEQRVDNFVKKQIEEGRQAYIVCPLIEESEEMDAKSVMELAENYKNKVFFNYRVEYLHGKMKQKEKDEIMEKFKQGKIDILISTTVIEVGVDVPNASIMIIENAERFGLAQLHQLRGRVGRGQYQSYCVLKYASNTEVARERMKIMTKTEDGFVIAEQDLKLRGSGEFFGTKQHGIPEFKIANLFQDMSILKEVQEVAVKIEKEDPKLEQEKNEKLKKLVAERFEKRIEL